MTNNVCVYILGRPGSGKDTQAKLLAEKFSLSQIRTSRLILAFFEEHKDEELTIKEKQIFESGGLVSPPFAERVVKERIDFMMQNNFEGKKGIVFSGSPRTYYEAKSIIPFCIDRFGRKNVIAIHLDVTEAECVNRIKNRDERKMDRDEDVIKTRMIEFNERTMPVINYCKEQNILTKVPGSEGIEKTFENVKTKFTEILWG